MKAFELVRSARAIMVLLGVGATACIPVPGGGVFQSLPVRAKRAPVLLIASGGSSCSVSSEVFARVQIGEKYRCVWREPQTQDPRKPSTPQVERGIGRQPPR